MTSHRTLSVWAIVVATILGAAWLYTFRVTTTFEYIEYLQVGTRTVPHHFHPSEAIREQPWWSVYATVALLVGGGAVAASLVYDRRRITSRLVAYFAKPS